MIDLNIKPQLKQHYCYERLFDAITMYTLFGGGAEGGKSWLGCEYFLLMGERYPGTRYFFGRDTLTSLMSSTFVSWQEVTAHHGFTEGEFWRFNGKWNFIEFYNGSRIDLLDLAFRPRDPMFERLGSRQYTQGWIEEAGEIYFEAFDTLKSRVGRWKNKEYGIPGKMLLTCNPKKNWLKRLFYDPWKKGTLPPEYAFIQALYRDNAYTADDAEKRLSSIENRQRRQRLKEGNWDYDDDVGAIFNSEKVSDMFTNTFVPSGERYLTADIAMQGSDKFVLIVWEGWRVIKIIVMEKCDAPEVEAKIKSTAEEFHVPRSNIAYDADGLGTFLRGYLKGAYPFKNGGKPKFKENYANLRTQCYFRFAKRVNTAGVYIRPSAGFQDQISEELSAVKEHNADKDGKLQVTPKDVIIRDLGHSPDFADALMMREVFDLKKKARAFSKNTIG